MNEQIKITIEIIEKLETRINSYWNFYVVVVVAIVGWLKSSETSFVLSQCIVLISSLCLFFSANLTVIRAATKRVVAFEKELNAISKVHDFSTNELKSELSFSPFKERLIWSYFLHMIVDMAVIYFVWSKLA